MAASRAQPQVGPKRVEQCEEFDEKKRECHVWFYARPINEKFRETNYDGTPAVHLFHWAITVCFPRGDRYFTFEAFDTDGKLVATRTKGAPTVFSVQQYLGTVSTSPADLLKIAQRNKYNDTGFDMTLRNCQTWIKEFAESLGKGIESKMDKFKTFVENEGVLIAAFISKLIGSYKFFVRC